MRTYRISFTSHYAYGNAAQRGFHAVRLAPRDSFGQDVLSVGLTVDPEPRRIGNHGDFFGNPVHWFTIDDAHENLVLKMLADVRVDRKPTLLGRDLDVNTVASQALLATDLGPTGPAHYLSATPFTQPDDALATFSQQMFPATANIQQASLVCAQHIQSAFRYDGSVTDVSTTASQALTMRAGVCQDFAHIMLAALRIAGVPAKYVSGYLRTDPPPGQPKLVGADAMHAWVSVWCGGDAGWIDYDPTNGCEVSHDHISVAIGRDYSDTAPVRGEVFGSGEQDHTVAVDVLELV